MNKTLAGVIVTSMTAATLVLAGCGGTQSSSQSAQSTATTQEQTNTQSTQSEQSTQSTQSQSTTSSSSQAPATESTGQISLEEATRIALQDAGVTEQDVTELDAKLETDDGVTKYDVNFKIGNVEHDYDIDPVTGAIMNHTTDIDD